MRSRRRGPRASTRRRSRAPASPTSTVTSVTLPAIVELTTASALGGGATVPRITTVAGIDCRVAGAHVTGAAGGAGSGVSPDDFEHAATASKTSAYRITGEIMPSGPQRRDSAPPRKHDPGPLRDDERCLPADPAPPARQ